MKAIKKDNNIIEVEVTDQELDHIQKEINKFNEDFNIKDKKEFEFNLLGIEVPDLFVGVIKGMM